MKRKINKTKKTRTPEKRKKTKKIKKTSNGYVKQKGGDEHMSELPKDMIERLEKRKVEFMKRLQPNQKTQQNQQRQLYQPNKKNQQIALKNIINLLLAKQKQNQKQN